MHASPHPLQIAHDTLLLSLTHTLCTAETGSTIRTGTAMVYISNAQDASKLIVTAKGGGGEADDAAAAAAAVVLDLWRQPAKIRRRSSGRAPTSRCRRRRRRRGAGRARGRPRRGAARRRRDAPRRRAGGRRVREPRVLPGERARRAPSLARAALDGAAGFFRLPPAAKQRARRAPGTVTGYTAAHADRFVDNLPWKETLSFGHRHANAAGNNSSTVADYFSTLGDDFKHLG